MQTSPFFATVETNFTHFWLHFQVSRTDLFSKREFINLFICRDQVMAKKTMWVKGSKGKKWVYRLGARFQLWTSSSAAVVDNHRERLGMLWKTLLHCSEKYRGKKDKHLSNDWIKSSFVFLNMSTKDLTYKRVSCGPMITTSHLYMSSSSIRPAEKPSTGFLLSSGKNRGTTCILFSSKVKTEL